MLWNKCSMTNCMDRLTSNLFADEIWGRFKGTSHQRSNRKHHSAHFDVRRTKAIFCIFLSIFGTISRFCLKFLWAMRRKFQISGKIQHIEWIEVNIWSTTFILFWNVHKKILRRNSIEDVLMLHFLNPSKNFLFFLQTKHCTAQNRLVCLLKILCFISFSVVN